MRVPPTTSPSNSQPYRRSSPGRPRRRSVTTCRLPFTAWSWALASPRINVALRAMSALVPGNFRGGPRVGGGGEPGVGRHRPGDEAGRRRQGHPRKYVKMMRNVGKRWPSLPGALSVRVGGSHGLTVEKSSARPSRVHTSVPRCRHRRCPQHGAGATPSRPRLDLDRTRWRTGALADAGIARTRSTASSVLPRQTSSWSWAPAGTRRPSCSGSPRSWTPPP